jgi:hypothetical protein
MQVTFTHERPFSGWPDFTKELLAFPPLTSLVVLAKVVHQNAVANDGTFNNSGSHNRVTHQVFQRLMLGLLTEEVGKIANTTHQDKFATLVRSGTFARLCGELGGLRSTHPALNPKTKGPPRSQMESGQWFTAIEQSPFVGPAKIELARTWIMYEKIWRQLVGDSLVPPNSALFSAFTDPKYALFLGLVLWHFSGYVENPQPTLSHQLTQNQVQTILDLFTVPLDEFIQRAGALGVYPKRFQNPFLLDPVIRLPNGALLAPDPTALFTGFEKRMLYRALRQGANDGGEDGFQQVSTAFGKVFEEYGRKVLRAIKHGAACQKYQDEFSYFVGSARMDSPDAFVLRGDTPLVFEFKSVRHPFDADAEVTAQGLTSWLNRVLGMTDKRPPLEQGLTFFRWLAANGANGSVCKESLNNYLYLLVTYDDPPWCANWPSTRMKLWPDLNLEQRALLNRALFVSIRDVEVAVTVAHFFATQGNPRSLGSLVREWRTSCQGPPQTFVNGQPAMLGSLASFLVERYPGARRHILPMHQEAFLEAFRAAADAGFPVGGVEQLDARVAGS